MNKKSILVILIILVIIGIVLILNLKSDNNDNNVNTDVLQVEDGFSVFFDEIDITPGKEFNQNDISKEVSISEIQSCATDGVDKIYTYEDVEITVSQINGKDVIYSVYFINDNIETAEGIKITDEKSKMIESYGTNFENSISNKYVYTKNNVNIAFLVENEVITGIEYTLILD